MRSYVREVGVRVGYGLLVGILLVEALLVSLGAIVACVGAATPLFNVASAPSGEKIVTPTVLLALIALAAGLGISFSIPRRKFRGIAPLVALMIILVIIVLVAVLPCAVACNIACHGHIQSCGTTIKPIPPEAIYICQCYQP
ncbi:MAG: hypothetical protein ABWJ97_06175 [Thermoproteus sp.]